MRRFYVGYWYYPIFIEPEDFIVWYLMQTAVNGAQLDLQEAVEFQQKTLFDVVMEAADGEIFSVLQIGNSLRVLGRDN